MGNYLKIKKRNSIITFLLIFNQLILSSYTFENKKIEISESEENYFPSKNRKVFKKLISSKKQIETNLSKQEPEYLEQYIKDLEKFVEETFDPNNRTNLENQEENNPKIETSSNSIGEKSINRDIKNNKLNIEKKIIVDQVINKKTISTKKTFKQRKTNKLLLPSRSTISTSEFNVPPRGYVKLSGPKISLNLKAADSIETLKLIAKLGNYGILIIEERNSKGESLENSKITANFEDVEISDVFNSILLSANLQAVVDNKMIFVGNNILNKSIKPKVSKTYRLNQVNAASVADYLSTLGANISKVMLVSGSIDGQEIEG